MNSSEYWDDRASKRCIVEGGIPKIFEAHDKHEVVADTLALYIKRGDRILELGAGAAQTAVRLIKKIGPTPYVDLDISLRFVSFVNAYVGLNALCRESEDSDFPFKDNRFDVVLMLDVLEHIAPEHREKNMNEIERVLCSSGAIFINNPVYQSKHSQDFEWLVDDMDILNLFYNWRIHQKVTYKIGEAPYEFVVLTRKKAA